MPLRAYVDDQEIISIDQSDEQWKKLKKRLKSKQSLVILPCCKQEGFLRKSSKGLKHFVHLKSNKTCDWKPESPEHLTAKIEIIEACKLNGWKAIPEFSEKNWIADVLATKDDKRIAFEVQWSSQTYENTIYRQERYKESGVRGCWFFRVVPKQMRNYDKIPFADNSIPAFKISKSENSEIIAQIEQTSIPLRDLVDSLLKRKLKFCNSVRLKPNQEIAIVFFEMSCWKCNKPQHCYTVDQNLLSLCNQDFHMIGSLWDDQDLDKHSLIYESVNKFLKSEQGLDIKVGELKKRYSRTVQDSYLSHGCYNCDAIFGDFHLIMPKIESLNAPESIRYIEKIDLDPLNREGRHWCYSEEGQFCQ